MRPQGARMDMKYMIMKRNMLISKKLWVCLMALLGLSLTAVAGETAVKFYLDDLKNSSMPADVAGAIEDKLLAALSRTEAVDMSPHNVFHIIPAVDFTEVAETEGMMREVARVQADLKLSAWNPIDGTVYNTVIIPLKGSAAGGKDAAMRKLANSVKATDPVFVRFVRTSRQRIQDHYAENCGNIIAQAQRLKGMGRYAEAASYLSAVPPSVACFDQSEALMGEVMPYLMQTPDTVVVEKVVETVVEVPVEQQPEAEETPVVTEPVAQTPASSGLGDVTIEGQNIDFEILSCKGDLKRRSIIITARALNDNLDDARVYVNLDNAITSDGTEFRDLRLNDHNYGSGYVAMPEGVPVKMQITIPGVRSRIDKLTYMGMTIRGIAVTVRNLPVSW